MVQTLSSADVQSIRNAAHLLNSTLTSRTYIEDKLLFNCINWKTLVSDQLENNPHLNDLVLTEKLYNNDKNVINLIHGLVSIIDKQRSQQKAFNETILAKDKKIESLQKQVLELNKRLGDANRGKSNKIIKYNTLQNKITDLTKQNKLYTEDLAKMKNWSMDSKNKYKVEIKRKNLQIENLQNKLTERSRNIPSGVEFGFGGNTTGNVDGLIVQGSIPIIENSTGLTINNSDLVIGFDANADVLNDSNQLVNIIESITKENYKFTKFLGNFKQFFHELNSALNSVKFKNTSVEKLPNPTNVINLKEVMVDPETVRQYFTEIEPSENIATNVLSECHKLFHNLEYLIDVINQKSDINNESTIAKLTKDLEIMKSNWQDALKTTEDWKNIALKTKQPEA
ncbi:Autophagy-related protein 25 [Candida viswanathii]|uniref:Autophagy-related protein 25 n=1 Tax=Candida viswanathii TaxID=5486 RepID=A0A367XP02_9ASCO|nr:Autophagy-related protein 25 [Candida viswanathii]